MIYRVSKQSRVHSVYVVQSFSESGMQLCQSYNLKIRGVSNSNANVQLERWKARICATPQKLWLDFTTFEHPLCC